MPIGQLNLWQQNSGRFGNLLFQHFIATRVAESCNLELHTPPWAGQRLFGLYNPGLEKILPTVEDHDPRPEGSYVWKAATGNASLSDVCLFGCMQYPTYHWPMDWKIRFAWMYKPVFSLAFRLESEKRRIFGVDRVIAVHIRRGDYLGWARQYGMFFCTPKTAYLKWIENHPLAKDAWVYVASDDPEAANWFRSQNAWLFKKVVTAESFDIAASDRWFVDFWMLSQADSVAISNSSFSFAATLIQHRECFRPTWDNAFVRYDPYNAEILLYRHEPQKACNLCGSPLNVTWNEKYCLWAHDHKCEVIP